MRMTTPCLAAMLLCACAATDDAPVDDTDTDTDVAPTTGRLLLRFAIDDAVAETLPEEESPPVGPFTGNVFPAEQVEPTGPIDDAEVLESVKVADITLPTDGTATAPLYTTVTLDEGWVTILGFFDSDGNADPEDPGPDQGDPVTLPGENEFYVEPGADTEVTVFFGLRNP